MCAKKRGMQIFGTTGTVMGWPRQTHNVKRKKCIGQSTKKSKDEGLLLDVGMYVCWMDVLQIKKS
jgi:hypothetical protein